MAGEHFLDVRNRLFDEIVLVADLWAQYKFLFMESATRINRLNSHARWFFMTVQRTYAQQLIVGVSRLTDPARSGGGRLNVSIATLLEDPRLEEHPEIGTELKAMVGEATAAAEPIRRHRNRGVAHLDRAAALGYEPLPDFKLSLIGELIKSLSRVHQLYGVHLLDRDASYDIYPMGSVDLLMEALELAPTRQERARQQGD